MTMTRPTTEQITHNGQLLSSVLDRAINVLDFGAVGDGVTDDMDALIAAVNAVKAAGGGTLYIPFTPNGYYLRYGAGCQLGGTNGISIVSNNATLKLQGGTLSQTQAVSVFYSSTSAGVQNLLIQGLRFEAASTVLRYGNGPTSPRHFEDQVDIGRADPLEQASFRDAINLQGASNNITIRDCYFKTLQTAVKVTDGAYGTPVNNVLFENLHFDGINSQSILVGEINKLTIRNIYDVDHKGSKFDWLFYLAAGLTDLVVSDVTYRQDSPVNNYGASAIGLDGLTNGAVLSNILIDGCGSNSFVIASSNVTMSSVVVKRVANSAGGALSFSGASNSNVVITGLVITDCPWCIVVGGVAPSVSISDFVFRNATRQFLGDFGAGSGVSMSFSHGTIIDCGSNTNSCIRKAISATAPVKLRFDDVRFQYTTYVPLIEIVDVRGANTVVEFSNCVFESLFGTCSKQPIYTGSGATVSLLNCSKTGWSTAMTYSGVTGSGVVSRVSELPLTETTLTVDSATPSVLGNLLFVTANTTATAITNFTDGVQGQEICVRVNDANTTFDFSGSNLKGNNGVDYVATSGDLVFAKRIGSNWYCTVCEA